jgi:hypothetical protein
MKARSLVSSSAAALLALGTVVMPTGSAEAAVTVLDFDYGPAGEPCAFADVGPLREKYAGFGIHFSGPNATDGGAIQDTCGNWGVEPRSGLRFLAFASDGQLGNGGVARWPEKISFDSVKRVVQIYVSQSGFSVGDATFTMVGKRAGKVIRTATVDTSTSDWVRLRVQARNGFSRVVLRASDPDDAWLADDLGIQN